MGREGKKRAPAEAELRRSQRLVKKVRIDPALVIDLDDDETEEEETWEPRSLPEGDGKRNDREEEARSVGTASDPISIRPILRSHLETTAELEKCNSMNEALRDLRIDLTAVPQATEETTLPEGRKDDIARDTGIDLDDPEVLGTIMDNYTMKFSFGDANLQQAEVVDQSSSESGDDGDGDNDAEIAEEQEEIVTTLSREDAIVFAEVMKAIKGGGDLRKFKVEQLKTYLRHHGLRMFGVKFVILNRIQEHQKIKDRGQEMYPRSSFSINCKGDVCLGDSVLFLQTVYNKPFDYNTRCASSPPLGKRWVAGKVVSESYGAGKQQHTFTIEVLWSTGIQPFYCMRPVKIKGRNLYRTVTMRQPWSNEAERQAVLDEKHARGAAARAIRRAEKGIKSKGKFRADSRVHPYRRPHGAESLGFPQQSTRQREDIHPGSSPAHVAPAVPLDSSMQHGASNERTGHQTCTTADHPGPPTTRGRSSLAQQSEAPWNVKRVLAPTLPSHAYPASMLHGRSRHTQHEGCHSSRNPAHNQPPPMPHGRSRHSQQAECQGNIIPAHSEPPSVPRGRSRHNQQEECRGNRNPAQNQPPPRQHGRSRHNQQEECRGKRNPAQNQPPPRQHRRNFQTQQEECDDNRNPAPPMQRGRRFHTQQEECRGNRNLAHNQPPPGAIRTQRQTSSQHVPSQVPDHQEPIRIPCSNANCRNAGAARCIMRSCGRCCIRKMKKGTCPRHE